MKTSLLIKLYGLVEFDRSAKARWLLEEMQVPYEMMWLDRAKKEHESPEYLALNPQGRVPVMTFQDKTIFESGAICSFLADYFLEKNFAPPLDSSLRAEYLQWMYFASSTLDVIQTRIMIIEDIQEPDLRMQKETVLLNDLDDAVNALDRILSKSNFLLNNRFSAADISVGYHLYFLTLWPELFTVIQKYPSVVQYIERLKERPAAQKTKALSYEG